MTVTKYRINIMLIKLEARRIIRIGKLSRHRFYFTKTNNKSKLKKMKEATEGLLKSLAFVFLVGILTFLRLTIKPPTLGFSAGLY